MKFTCMAVHYSPQLDLDRLSWKAFLLVLSSCLLLRTPSLRDELCYTACRYMKFTCIVVLYCPQLDLDRLSWKAFLLVLSSCLLLRTPSLRDELCYTACRLFPQSLRQMLKLRDFFRAIKIQTCIDRFMSTWNSHVSQYFILLCSS